MLYAEIIFAGKLSLDEVFLPVGIVEAAPSKILCMRLL